MESVFTSATHLFFTAVIALPPFENAMLVRKGLTASLLVMFEVLHRPLVSFGRFFRTERAQVPASAGLGILFARVQAVLAGL